MDRPGVRKAYFCSFRAIEGDVDRSVGGRDERFTDPGLKGGSGRGGVGNAILGGDDLGGLCLLYGRKGPGSSRNRSVMWRRARFRRSVRISRSLSRKMRSFGSFGLSGGGSSRRGVAEEGSVEAESVVHGVSFRSG
jgi:hypothetical protein